MNHTKFVDIDNWEREDLERILEGARRVKRDPFQSELEQKNMAMIFAKPSTRTRTSFEVGMTQLGGHALFLGPDDLQLGRGETISDTAKVLSRYVDMTMARLFEHEKIVELAEESTVPVINGLTDWLHPCQSLTDLLTIKEHKGLDVTASYVGDGNNVCHSLMQIFSKFDIPFRVGCPEGYGPDKEIQDRVDTTTVVHSPEKAVEDVDVIYTDAWVSMGDEEEAKERKRVFPPFQVNEELLSHAKDDAIVMHCLPAHRGQEITDKVMDGTQSVVFDEAENRLHAQKALILDLLR